MAHNNSGSLPQVCPDGYHSLSAVLEAIPSSVVDFIGVVIDKIAPTTTRTGDEMFTVKLADASVRDTMNSQHGLRVRFFRKPNESKPFPLIQNIGDVAIMKAMKVQHVSGQTIAISSRSSTVLVVSAASIRGDNVDSSHAGDPEHSLHVSITSTAGEGLTSAEQIYVIQLAKEMYDTVDGVEHSIHNAGPIPNVLDRSHPSIHPARVTSFGPKFALVCDLRHAMFKDLVVEVVRQFDDQWGNCEIYVTDYTENKDLWYYVPPEEETGAERDGDFFNYSATSKKNWSGPYGYLVLKVNIKRPHDEFVRRHVQVGKLLLLRNVKIKLNPNSSNARLEGDMWKDDRNPEKVNISVQHNYDVMEVTQLLERKNKYTENRRKHDVSPSSVMAPPITLSKNQQKKRKRKIAKEKQSTMDNGELETPREVDGDGENTTSIAANTRNQHIRCTHVEHPIVPLSTIIDVSGSRHTCQSNEDQPFRVPFILASARTKVRVVDFEPANLEDFAYVDAGDDESDEEQAVTSHTNCPPKTKPSQLWRWHWILHLEDATIPSAVVGERARIAVQVHHEFAQFLLGNDMPDPQDLRKHPEVLKKLHYKLSILWGNLAECRGTKEPLSNLPFECCLHEYGVEIDTDDWSMLRQYPYGWMRLYSLFGTTISS